MRNTSGGDFLQWMRTFILVAETGSIHRTANILCISPPAVSHHIRKLEQDLNVNLFDRKSTGMSLTQAGIQFQASCLPLMEEVEKLREFKEHKRVLRGNVRLTMVNRLALSVIRDVLDFRSIHPHVTFSMEPAAPGRVLRNIERGSADLAVTVYSELPGAYQFTSLRPSSAYLYTPPGNPYHLPAKPTWDEICVLPFISLTMDGYVNPVVPTLPEMRQPENVLLTVVDFLLALQIVKGGIGVCIAPPLTPFENPADYSMFNIDHIFPIGSFGLLVRRESYLTPQVRAFMEFLRERYRRPDRFAEGLPP